MKQIKILQVYNVTEELSANDNLSINAKWLLYKLRKDLIPHREFYIEEVNNLLSKFKVTVDGDKITFESEEKVKEYQSEQQKIDDYDIDLKIEKKPIKLSEIPNISIKQIEQLEEFFEFEPE